MLADQFQRNGVVLDQLQRFGMATLLLSVGEEQRALLPTLKTLQQTRRGDGRIKRRPIRAGTSICALADPSPPLLANQPSPPLRPKRPKRPGNDARPLRLANGPTAQWTPRAPCAHRAVFDDLPAAMRRRDRAVGRRPRCISEIGLLSVVDYVAARTAANRSDH